MKFNEGVSHARAHGIVLAVPEEEDAARCSCSCCTAKGTVGGEGYGSTVQVPSLQQVHLMIHL